VPTLKAIAKLLNDPQTKFRHGNIDQTTRGHPTKSEKRNGMSMVKPLFLGTGIQIRACSFGRRKSPRTHLYVHGAGFASESRGWTLHDWPDPGMR